MTTRIVPGVPIGNGRGLGDTFPLVDGATITTALQDALDDTDNRVIRLMTPGTYYISPSTTNPYQASSKCCLTITRDDVDLIIGPGVTLKMTANTQTDANGICYGIVFRDRDNIYIGGGGTIDMNSQNQSGWTGANLDGQPYGQERGGCIRGYYDHTNGSSPGCTNITVEDLSLINTFGNPCNVYSNRTVTAESHVYFRRLYCEVMGEGLQIVGAKNCGITECQVYDSSDVARGDALEISDCRNFLVDSCIVRGSGNGGDQGSACDIYLSREGTVSNNIFDGWSDGIGCGWQSGSQRIENISITGNVIKNVRSGYTLPVGGNLSFTNNWWIDITTAPPAQSPENAYASCTATASGTTVTVTAANHSFATGDLVQIRGANETGCNGVFKLTRISSTQFSYTASSAPGGNPTGTITYRPGRQATAHIGDRFIRCTQTYWIGPSEVDLDSCWFIGGTTHAVLAYESAYGDKPSIRVRNCKFIENAGTAIIVSGVAEFAPALLIADNYFSGNGATIAGDNAGVITLCTIRDNEGYPNPTPFNPGQMTNVRSWYRYDMGLFQNTAKTTAAINTSDPVRVWTDSLGTGPDLVAPSDAARPTRTSRGGILGNGSSQYLATASNTFDNEGPFTILFRLKTRTTYPYSDKIASITTNTTTQDFGAYQGSTFYYSENDDAAVSQLSTSTTATIVAGISIAADGSVTLWKSDGTTAAGSYSATEDATAYLMLLAFSDGGAPPSPSGYGTGELLDVIVLDEVISLTEFLQVQQYFDNTPTAFNGDYWSLSNIPAASTFDGNPTSDDGQALGTTALKWSDLFLASGSVINFNAGDVTITHSANNITVAGGNLSVTSGDLVLGQSGNAGHIDLADGAGGANTEIEGYAGGVQITGTVKTTGTISPVTNDGAALGTSSLMFSDLFLASGAVINFNNGDVTVTHSANTLAFAGASSGYTFDAAPIVYAPASLPALLFDGRWISDPTKRVVQMRVDTSGFGEISINRSTDTNGMFWLSASAGGFFQLCSGGTINWSDTANAATGQNANLTILKDAADTLAQRRSTNAQTFRCYGTYTDSSNYVRAALSASTTSITLAAETAGTGADDVDVLVTPAGVGNARVGVASRATNATGGFLYIPSCAGTPTGTPTAITGMVPLVVDSTNNKLYFFSGGAWRDAGP